MHCITWFIPVNAASFSNVCSGANRSSASVIMDPLNTSTPILYSVTPAMYMAMFRLSDVVYDSDILEAALNALAIWCPPEGMYMCQVLERDGINAIVQEN